MMTTAARPFNRQGLSRYTCHMNAAEFVGIAVIAVLIARVLKQVSRK
jgi:hypothetical protein